MREARPSNYAHNKFMVLVREGKAQQVWTGSTNISEGGIFGQTNVGHWLRDPDIADDYKQYWELLSDDPGARKGQKGAEARKENQTLYESVEKLTAAPDGVSDVISGVTALFSPRTGLSVLDLYVQMVASAKREAGITLAFGIGAPFKDALLNHGKDNAITFLLLERKDKPTKKNAKVFEPLTAANNVYEAWGSYIDDPVYQWARETNATKLRLTEHVSYIHSKFLLMDPLSADPIVVTGSANFSKNSTNGNDENMIVIRDNQRVADIYFTEFNRLFNHYYFRAVMESKHDAGVQDDAASLFLDETGGWLGKYKPNTLRANVVRCTRRWKAEQPSEADRERTVHCSGVWIIRKRCNGEAQNRQCQQMDGA